MAAGSLVVVGVTASVAQASVSADDAAEHTVSTVQPEGTEINLFDYWITSADGRDDTTSGIPEWEDRGINKDHPFKFGNNMRQYMDQDWCLAGNDPLGSTTKYPCSDKDGKDLGWVNAGGVVVRQGIVEPNLDENGYPVLTGTYLGRDFDSESLAYLFNPEVQHEGKQSYESIGGLLRYVDGYYTYDSKTNYAALQNNELVVYDAPAIASDSGENNGQFFPFDPASEVFTGVGDDGTLEYDSDDHDALHSNDDDLNHFFGLTMHTQFTQPADGKTADGKAVTYNFSGDDDVWVFVDGMLVGDVGGIHGATNLEINFATGKVFVYRDGGSGRINRYDEGIDTKVEETTIKDMVMDANPNLASEYFDGETLADYSTHTLQFFYLERGHTDSNMSLSFNLQETPASTIHKTNQDGQPLSGVTFNLYTEDQFTSGAESAWFTGKTDSNGDLTITDENGTFVSLAQLQSINHHWVLKEQTPSGYRSAPPVHLQFDDSGNLSISDNSGQAIAATVRPHVTSTAVSGEISDADLSAGTTFAVVEQCGDGDAWHPVSGSADEGWSVSQATGVLAAIDAAKSYGSGHVMDGDSFRIYLDELPGGMADYANTDNALYRIAYYHTIAETLEGASGQNTTALDANNFHATYSATIEVSNIQDTLTIHKTDTDNSIPLAGATFTLYKGNDDGSEGEVTSYTYTTDVNGNVSIPMDVLTAGDYVLKETAWPTGYENTSISINLHVDDSGVVYVDAGAENDNVSVSTTLGSLAWSLHNQAVDNGPLAAVSAGMQIGEYADGSMTWESSGNVEDLTFDAETGVYHTNADTAFSITADAGWSRIHVNHDADVLDSVIGVNTVINVSNTVKTLSVDQKLIKYIQGRDWQTDDQFTFRLDGYEAVESGESWSLIKESVVPTPVGATAVAGETSVWDLVLDYDAQSCAAGTEGDLSSCEKQIKFSIPYNKTEDGKIYVFIVSEVEPNDPEPGMVYSKDRWLVSMYVSGSSGLQTDLPVKVPEDWQPGQSLPSTFDLDGPIEFTNRFIEVSALPLTGGDTTARNIMLAGGGVLLLAGATWLLARRRRV